MKYSENILLNKNNRNNVYQILAKNIQIIYAYIYLWEGVNNGIFTIFI